ncbi:MAG: polyprenyl synthetase family protein [Armatimonadota bacterium]
MSAHALHSNQAISRPTWAVPIADLLDAVEDTIESAIDSRIDIVSHISTHVFSAGGKRIRPALVILSASACGSNVDRGRVTKLAAAVELVHTASLLHDDVVDSAAARRGVCTANSLWGNRLSVLGGDFLLSKAFSLLACAESTEILSVLSSAAVSMAESEMLQAASEGSLDCWRANYWQIIQGKTAALMAACCECGALLAGADAGLRQAFSEYGTSVGLAFQITDDLLDIVGNPAQTGKDVGTDLMNGKFTLPVLLAYEKDSALINGMVGSGRLSREDARRVAALVLEHGTAEQARRVAQDYADRACRALDAVPESGHTSALRALAGSLVQREA